MAAPCGSATLILISAEARTGRKKASKEKTTKRRESFMDSSFVTRKGLVVAVRAGLLASRVEDASVLYDVRQLQPAFPGLPSDRLRISSLTVARQRGIFTRFPHALSMHEPNIQL